jgi:hypothetical protein
MLHGDAAALYAAKHTGSDVDLSDPEIVAAWERVRAGDSAYALLTYAPPSKRKLSLLAEGRHGGGLREIEASLAPSAVVYGGFRARVEGAQHASDRLVFLAYCGQEVGPILKGKSATHRADVEQFLDGTVGAVHVNGDDAEAGETLAAIEARVRELLGAPPDAVLTFPPLQ